MLGDLFGIKYRVHTLGRTGYRELRLSVRVRACSSVSEAQTGCLFLFLIDLGARLIHYGCQSLTPPNRRLHYAVESINVTLFARAVIASFELWDSSNSSQGSFRVSASASPNQHVFPFQSVSSGIDTNGIYSEDR